MPTDRFGSRIWTTKWKWVESRQYAWQIQS
jgi:hypothetical protein